MLRLVRKGVSQRALSAGSPVFPGTGLNEDQLVWQDAAQKWGAAELGPYSAEWDAKCHYPIDVIKSSAEQGFLGLYTSEDVGGMGLSRLETSIVVEALSEHCVPTTAMMTIHNMVSWMIDVNGTPEQREEFCPRLTSGEIIGSYCLTEPGSGSDASALATTCIRDGDDYVLNGSKCFISGAGVHDLYAVMVRTDPSTKGPKGISCVLIPKDTPGLSFGKDETKMGWKSHPTRVLIMENCRVPVKNLLGVEGKGFNIAMSGLNGGRAFGQTLDRQQYLQYKMAELATQLVTSRLMVRHAASAIDNKDPAAASLCAMAKLHATDSCSEVANG
ncbi:Oidioi.mRNA.OKI2018_I69.chr2.g6890.t1.cds, partial [Oikopleura dioica]